MTDADNPENTVPAGVFASWTLDGHRRALTITTDYGTDPSARQTPPKQPNPLKTTPPSHWPEPAITTVTGTGNCTGNCGKTETRAWDRVHPRLAHRSSRLDHDGGLLPVEGTSIRLEVEHLSKDRDSPPCGHGPPRPVLPRTT
ncbi:hypothetical protein [Streptomyces sp. IBSBF 2435]|uniref:hypothetical protein n=1 Tax=Streptomyces sp. IBSBF 2435 TaxID=2903531 RepID=UPI003FA6AA5C